MIAVITSCIRPPELVSGKQRTFVPISEREKQTIVTVQKLVEAGFEQIVLADNSEDFDFSQLKALFPRHLQVYQFKQYQFSNKGINEVLLLLAILQYLPHDVKLFKISGRYYPDENFNPDFGDDFDFKFKGFSFKNRTGAVSTRAYFIRDKRVYEEFLTGCLEEIFSYQHRMVGVKSFIRFLSEIFHPGAATRFTVPVEFAAARVLKYGNFSYQLVDPIGVEGVLAGFDNLEFIKE